MLSKLYFSMTENTFFQALLQAFSHTPTPSQHTALQLFSSYLFDPEATEKLFLLKGFAGTGKTSITNALIAALPLISHHSVLLAPTGRAAKVMTFFTRQPAFTIHKYIYYHRAEGGELAFTLRPNKAQRTLFIVDEASMIADNDGAFGSRSLLDDLMRFVYSGTDCKLLLIGDAAQLPPVHTHGSPALNIAHLEYQYQKEVVSTQLTDVVRQRRRSGILRNATALRKTIFGNTSQPYFQFRIGKSADLIRLYNGEEIQEALVEAYDNYGSDETTIIVRANKRAVDWNQQVRRVILETEDEIEVGDLLMVVKNNYFWCKDNPKISFIANGDTIEVVEILGFYENYGFRFAEITAQLIDYPDQPPFDTVVLLDTLTSDSAALSPAQSQSLYEEVLSEYAEAPSTHQQYQQLKQNPYYNALQVKFAYALTCHKSQGGQWDVVFIEKPYLPPDYVIDESYYRWLYTALTRAKRKAYLVGFSDDDFWSAESDV